MVESNEIEENLEILVLEEVDVMLLEPKKIRLEDVLDIQDFSNVQQKTLAPKIMVEMKNTRARY